MFSLKYFYLKHFEDKCIVNFVKYSSRSKGYYNQIVLPNAHQDDGGDAPGFPKEEKPC